MWIRFRDHGKGNEILINEEIKKVKGTFEDKRECSIRRYQVSGTTVETPVFYSDEKNRYLHIYYSYGKAASECEALESRLDRMAAYLGRLEEQPVVVDKSYFRQDDSQRGTGTV